MPAGPQSVVHQRPAVLFGLVAAGPPIAAPPLQAGSRGRGGRRACRVPLRGPIHRAQRRNVSCGLNRWPSLSQLSHGLAGRYRTRPECLDIQWTLTCGYGLCRTGRTHALIYGSRGRARRVPDQAVNHGSSRPLADRLIGLPTWNPERVVPVADDP
jgi:hypothetical protein